MIAKIITPECSFDCEMIVGLDASLETQEIRKIYDESITICDKNTCHIVSLSDFRNTEGQTIGDYLLDKNEPFAVKLSQKDK